MTISRLLRSTALWVVISLLMVGFAAHAEVAFDPTSNDLPQNAVWVESIGLDNMFQEFSMPQVGKSLDGHPLTINGTVYPHGIGTHATSELTLDIKGAAERFVAMVGLDDEVHNQGEVVFRILVDGKVAASASILKNSKESKLLSVDLRGAKQMVLQVDAGADIYCDHADWAGAVIFLVPGAKDRPVSVPRQVEPPMPISSGVSDKPSINGPRIVGATPGYDFLFLIPATGKGPLTYSAKGLPTGLTLDSKTGIISGSLKSTGETVVELTVKGTAGTVKRNLTIVGGDHKLALTPPMGWNSWNVWANAIDDQKVRDAADYMVKSGLAAHGYQYINLDDTWEAGRDANGEIQTNKKFPDMKALADYIHSKGLKFGIYSSPGPRTCAGFTGSYQHEEQDAKTWAKWGVDYIKYDWCSYGGVAGKSLDDLQKPYRVLRTGLDKCGRDIVFSLCQYGMGDVCKWGAETGGNTWRTGGDISDFWGSMAGNGFALNGLEKYAGPGHWNDPDMLIVGKLGWGPQLRDTKLTPNEQITHISLWSMVASPLLIGCDMSKMNQFTIDVLTNDEVLAVNQDPLGKAAGCKSKDDKTEVWARPLWDGTTAVALFNRGDNKTKITAKWVDLGITGKQPVRDLWQKKDLGTFDNSFSAEVPTHGTVLIKVGKPNKL